MNRCKCCGRHSNYVRHNRDDYCYRCYKSGCSIDNEQHDEFKPRMKRPKPGSTHKAFPSA